MRFERHGPKVLLVAPNLDWRSSSAQEAERRGLEDSFARSVLWGFPIVAEEDEYVLVDGTDFFLRDAHDISAKLQRAGQGAFRLEMSRSTLSAELVKSFAQNTEIGAWLTFLGDRPGPRGPRHGGRCLGAHVPLATLVRRASAARAQRLPRAGIRSALRLLPARLA